MANKSTGTKTGEQVSAENPLKNDVLASMLFGSKVKEQVRKEDQSSKELMACFYYRSAIDCIESGEIERGLTFLRKVVVVSPKFQECYIDIANLLCIKGDAAGAIYFLKKSIHISPSVGGFVNLGNIMVEQSRPDKALCYFKNALKLETNVVEAHCGIGNALSIKGKYHKALKHYKKALSLKEKNRAPGLGIRNVYQKLVPNWHFAMMNDAKRNSAYERAILSNLNSSTVVLDIGSGGGLLSLIAARAGAKKVYTCEQNKVLADKATEIINRNGFGEKVVLITGKSQGIKVKRDIPRKADVVVTEIFDAGLIGENSLYVIKHAKDNLLKREGKIIPMGATVFGALVESRELADKYRMDQVAGFNFSSFNDFSAGGYVQENVADFDLKYMSDIFEVFSFDFYNIKIDSYIKTLPVRVIRKGQIHAVVFWFKLFLTENISLDTGPTGKTHWKQAVQFTVPFTEVKPGKVLKVNAFHDSSSISFTID